MDVNLSSGFCKLVTHFSHFPKHGGQESKVSPSDTTDAPNTLNK